jgi:glutamine synthetase
MSAAGTTRSHLHWMQLTFVDVFGTYCSVAVPGSKIDAAFSGGIVFDGSALEGRVRLLESDMRLLGDPDTLVETAPGRARAVGTVCTPDGAPWPGDPRNALKMVLDAQAELAGHYRATAELEFYLLDDQREPVDRAGYFDDVDGLGIRVARQAAGQLIAHGIDVESCHHEAGPGQYEIDLALLPPLELADALVIAKHTVRRIAREAGLRATFMARPLSGRAGSGLHVHQRAGGLLLDGSGRLTGAGRSFVAGQLAHARGLCALASPTINSYRRLHAGPEAPAAAVWGHANRAALIRVSEDLGADASIEFRGADPGANPYLLLAGLLAAGAAGLEAELTLDAPLDEFTGGIEPAQAHRFDRLPRNLDEALDALSTDDVLLDAFDNVLVTILETGRRAELEDFRAEVTPWEIDRYLEES